MSNNLTYTHICNTHTHTYINTYIDVKNGGYLILKLKIFLEILFF